MILSRTPLRMSFVGGGSDLPAFYRHHDGAVVSTTINKYVYCAINTKFDDKIRLSYSKQEEVIATDQIEHKLIRACLKHLNIQNNLELMTMADVPSKGTGLGSSSAFLVGLLKALHTYLARNISATELSEESCQIEIEHCGEPIGKQDQYAAAFGGLNLIEFKRNDQVIVTPIRCNSDFLTQLENHLLLFYTGVTRSASNLLKQVGQSITLSTHKQNQLKKMTHMAYELRDLLENQCLHAFGELLHTNWLLKKSLHNEISDDRIDHWYEKARSAGAIGGKLLGAGGGGFLLFYAAPNQHESITNALAPLKRLPFAFEKYGSQIIFSA